MKRKSFLPLLLLLSLASFLTACTIPVRTVVKGPLLATDVPQEFDAQKHILLVAAMQRLDKPETVDQKRTADLEKALQKYFPYRYVVVTKNEIYGNPERYSDTTVYRFALVSKRKTLVDPWLLEGEFEEGISFAPGFSRTYIDFAFYSRADKQHYPFSGSGTSVMKIAVNNVTTRINKALALRSGENKKATAAMAAKHIQNGTKTY